MFKLFQRAYHSFRYAQEPKLPAAVVKLQDKAELRVKVSNGEHPKTVLSICGQHDFITMPQSPHPLFPDTALKPSQALVPHEILYGIPQVTWDLFLEQLSRPSISTRLNLSEQRHLWLGYNHCRVAETPATGDKLAGLIGAHHYLLEFLRKANEQNYLWRNDKKKSEFIRLLRQGYMDHALLRDAFPGVQPALWSRLNFCTDFETIAYLNQLVLSRSYLSFVPRDSDAGRLREKQTVESVPDSRNQPQVFSNFITTAEQFKRDHGMRGMHYYAKFFFNGRKDWFKREVSTKTSFKIAQYDYFSKIYYDLIEAQVIKHLIREHPDLTYDHLLKDALSGSVSMWLADRLTYHQFCSLSSRWLRNQTTLKSKKPFYSNADHTWEKIIDDVILDGYRVTCINTKDGLYSHGKEMIHCVAGYVDYCLKNESNILVITDPNGHQSTLELRLDAEGKTVYISGHCDKEDSEPDNDHRYIASKLVRHINGGIIPMRSERVEEPPRQYTRTVYEYPYPLGDNNAQEQVYQVWRDLRLLPGFLEYSTYSEFIQTVPVAEMVAAFCGKNLRQSEVS